MKIKASKLIMDDELLSLRPVNPYYVSRYRQAMRQGSQFPALLVENDSMTIVSGNHRIEAYRQEFGEDVEVECTLRTYESRVDMIRDFAKENSTHGIPLGGWSKKAIIQKLLHLDDTPEDIARVFNISVKRVEIIGGLTVGVVGKKKKVEYKPVKRGTEVLRGKTITEDQYEEHLDKDKGTRADELAYQLIRWIQNGWIDMEDESVNIAMMRLHVALNNFLEGKE